MQCILGGLIVHILGGIQYTLGGPRVRMLGEMQYNTGWLVHDCLEYKNGREYRMHISLIRGQSCYLQIVMLAVSVGSSGFGCSLI